MTVATVAGPRTPLDFHHRCGRHVLGGGPINASRAFRPVAEYLGLDWRPKTLTFIGERDRTTIQDLLGPGGMDDFLFVPGTQTRNQISMRDGKEHTEYGATTIEVSDDDIAALVQQISQAEPGSWCGLTGSLPDGMSAQYFLDVISILQELRVAVALDTRGHLLKALLEMGCYPDIIFPNKAELELLVADKLKALGLTEIDPLDDNLLFDLTTGILPDGGIVVATLGPYGVFLRRRSHAWRINGKLPPGVDDVTRNGCGDALFGGTLAGLNAAGLELSDEEVVWAVMLGVGAANAAMASVEPGGFPLELFRAVMQGHLVCDPVR